jgi:hypothetical protein
MGRLPASAKRLVLGVALAVVGCERPDSTGLYETVEPAPGAAEPASVAGSPNEPASDVGGVETGGSGAGNGEAAPPVASLEPPGDDAVASNDADADAAPPADAGTRASPDSGTPDEPDAGLEPPPVEPACGGTLVDGVCWYLGAVDTACDDECGVHGGVDTSAAGAIGTPEQGGSLDTCTTILRALGTLPGVVTEGFRQDALGFGCHLFTDAEGVTSAWWLTAPAFSTSVSNPNARLVCGCVR